MIFATWFDIKNYYYYFTDDRTTPTHRVLFFPFHERDVDSRIHLKYQSITAMPEYRKLSIEVYYTLVYLRHILIQHGIYVGIEGG
jgi:hypothetical protein